MLDRLWTYQRERFPLVVHAPLIAALALSATSFPLQAHRQPGLPSPKSFLVAFISSLAFFFQLRIADEWKDLAEDAQFRPHRPVPRGLISLHELAVLGFTAGGVQLALALWLDPRLLGWLLLVWTFIGLMTKEFFLREWLRLRPLAYMGSHMLVVPLIYLYSVVCMRQSSGPIAQLSLTVFLAAGFFTGIVIEIGRKLRAPKDEELGVATYSVTWGIRRSVIAWNVALLLACVLAITAATTIGSLQPTVRILVPAFVGAVGCSLLYCQAPTARTAKLMEVVSGGWALLLYLTVGPLTALLKMVDSWRLT